MRTKTTVIPMRLTPTELKTLDDIVATGLYESRSGAIRAGLGMLFDKHHVDYNTDRQMESERRIHAPRKSNLAMRKQLRAITNPPLIEKLSGNTKQLDKPTKKARS